MMREEIKPRDFLGNEISIGDEVALFALHYRTFVKGIVIKIAPKMLFVEYNNTWNFDHHKVTIKQEHRQVIDLTALSR